MKAAATYSRTLPDGPETREQGHANERRTHRLDRLQRAWELVISGGVEIVGADCFKVRGNVEPFYYVDLAGSPPCYCQDMAYRERLIKGQCKHVLACKLSQLDAVLLDSLSDMMAAHQFMRRRAAGKRGLPHGFPVPRR